MSQLRWLVTGLARRLWVRATLFAVAGILTAFAGIVLAPLIPGGWSIKVGADSIDAILQILASSMLAVTTFSLATMVSVYATASTATTPRVVELLIRDRSAQNALGTFVGSFLFSLVGIIALHAGAYGDSGQIVLFVATLAVIVVIVVTLLRWIDLLARFGRVGDAIDRVEVVATRALRECREHPWLGGRMPSSDFPAAGSVTSDRIGYVQHIDVAALERLARLAGGEIHVEARPGAFVDGVTPLARLDFVPDEETRQAVRSAFHVGSRRWFDQDPRFGVVVLSEIAAKALSAAVNDQGTAIETLATLERVLAVLAGPREGDGEVLYPHVVIPPVAIDDLFDDAFLAISTCGAGTLAVGIRLQKTLLALARLGHPAFRGAARRQSKLALDRARHALQLEEDVAELERLSAGI